MHFTSSIKRVWRSCNFGPSDSYIKASRGACQKCLFLDPSRTFWTRTLGVGLELQRPALQLIQNLPQPESFHRREGCRLRSRGTCAISALGLPSRLTLGSSEPWLLNGSFLTSHGYCQDPKRQHGSETAVPETGGVSQFKIYEREDYASYVML